MKIVIGTANFNQNYGLINSKIKNSNEVKKILDYCRKKKINYLDTSFSYNLSNEFIKKLNFENFRIITKIKLPKKRTKFFIENLEKKIKKELKLYKINKFYAILFHDSKDVKSKYGNEFLKKIMNIKKIGLVDKIGISVYETIELDLILKKFKPDIVQFPVSIIDRRFLNKKLILKLKKMKIKIQARSIFLQGLLLKNPNKIKSLKYNKKLYEMITSLFNWCKNKNLDLKEACLIFIKNQKNIEFLTIGIESLIQLKQNIASLQNDKNFDLSRFASNDKKIIDPRKW
jgi:aryl-alcohol dehydrogenase-like predicted oxidoreductase